MWRPATGWELEPGHEIDTTLVAVEGLGGGHRYEVYRAWDRLLLCPVVVKVLRRDRMEQDRARAAFVREVDVSSRAHHPNLVRMLRWSEAPRPYLVLELVNAPSLADHLGERGPLSVPETCLLGARVLAALHHLHEMGFAHLDVKPANVILGVPPRLIDLSLARSVPARLDRPTGSAPYMAPEQCRAEEVTAASDLFGVGATLYESVSGTRSFDDGAPADGEPAMRFPQLEREPQPLAELLPGAPRGFVELLHACLAREPIARPRSAREVALGLAEVLRALGHEEVLGAPSNARL